jgi:hypothetical protein
MRHEASSLSCHRLLGKVAYPVFEGFPAMAKQPTAQIAEATSEALTKSGAAAEKIMEGNAEALTESGNSSGAAIQELTKAYQELAAKNAKNLTAAMPLPDGRSRREADIADGGRGRRNSSEADVRERQAEAEPCRRLVFRHSIWSAPNSSAQPCPG